MHNTPGERFDRIESGEAYKPDSRALDPRNIVIAPGWNPRDINTPESQEHIANIKASIMERVNENPPLPGLIKPLEVRYETATGVTTLVDGECRLWACRQLWDEGQKIFVPCKVLKGTTEQLMASALASNEGLALTQLQYGIGCQRLQVGYNWSTDRIAAHTCKSKKYVTDAIALANSSPEAKELLAAGEVTPSRILHAEAGKGGDSIEQVKREVASRPRQTPLPGAKGKSKPQPITRPRKQSEREKMGKRAAEYTPIADKLAKKVLDPDCRSWREVSEIAHAYRKARGLE